MWAWVFDFSELGHAEGLPSNSGAGVGVGQVGLPGALPVKGKEKPKSSGQAAKDTYLVCHISFLA